MKHILVSLFASCVVASAQYVSLPLLSGPLVYTNSVTALAVIPSTVGDVTLYYTNQSGQVVRPNSGASLVVASNVWTTNANITYPTALPSSMAFTPAYGFNGNFSAVYSRAGTSNSVVFYLSRSYDGVNFVSTNAQAGLNSHLGIAVPQAFAATATPTVFATNLPSGWLDGVRAVRLEAVTFGAGSNGIVRVHDARLTGIR